MWFPKSTSKEERFAHRFQPSQISYGFLCHSPVNVSGIRHVGSFTIRASQCFWIHIIRRSIVFPQLPFVILSPIFTISIGMHTPRSFRPAVSMIFYVMEHLAIGHYIVTTVSETLGQRHCLRTVALRPSIKSCKPVRITRIHPCKQTRTRCTAHRNIAISIHKHRRPTCQAVYVWSNYILDAITPQFGTHIVGHNKQYIHSLRLLSIYYP